MTDHAKNGTTKDALTSQRKHSKIAISDGDATCVSRNGIEIRIFHIHLYMYYKLESFLKTHPKK